jgi:hypothetical protein
VTKQNLIWDDVGAGEELHHMHHTHTHTHSSDIAEMMGFHFGIFCAFKTMFTILDETRRDKTHSNDPSP